MNRVGSLSFLLLQLLFIQWLRNVLIGLSVHWQRCNVSSNFILDNVKKQIVPCQLPCFPISPSLLSIHRPCFSFPFPSGSLSGCFLPLGSKANCWAFVLARVVAGELAWFQTVLLSGCGAVGFSGMCAGSSFLGGTLPFGSKTSVCSKLFYRSDLLLQFGVLFNYLELTIKWENVLKHFFFRWGIVLPAFNSSTQRQRESDHLWVQGQPAWSV